MIGKYSFAGHAAIVAVMSFVQFAFAEQAKPSATRPASGKPHIVLVSAEPECHSAESLKGLADELQAKYGFRCTLLVGASDKNIPGLDALKDADLAIFFMGSLTLPEDQMKKITTYLYSRRPLVAIRTSTHAFLNWKEFAAKVLGTPDWQYDYGHESSTDIHVNSNVAKHPILHGVDQEFHSRSWLYYVHPLDAKALPLMIGKSVGPSDRAERVENPVAWTMGHHGGRVFYTSMGHPDDFKLAPFRRMLINAVFWGLNRPIPDATSGQTTSQPAGKAVEKAIRY